MAHEIAALRAAHLFSRGLVADEALRRNADSLSSGKQPDDDAFEEVLSLLNCEPHTDQDLGLLVVSAGAVPCAAADKLAAAVHVEFGPFPQLHAPLIPIRNLWGPRYDHQSVTAALESKQAAREAAARDALTSMPVCDARELLAAPSGRAACGCTAVDLLGAKNHFTPGASSAELNHMDFNLQESSDDDSDSGSLASRAVPLEAGFADLTPQLLVPLPSSSEWVARALRLYPRALAVVGHATRMWGPMRGCSIVVFDLLFSADRFRYWASVVQQCERRLMEAARRIVESPAAAAVLGLAASSAPIVISSSSTGSAGADTSAAAAATSFGFTSGAGAGGGSAGVGAGAGSSAASDSAPESSSTGVGKKRGRWDKQPLRSLPALADATSLTSSAATGAQVIEVRPNIQRAEAILWLIMYANRLVRLAVGSVMGQFKFVSDDKGDKNGKTR